MIVISGIIVIDPAKTDHMIGLTTALVKETRAESGNVAYEYTQDPTDPARWRVFEEWADEDAVNTHMGTEHMAQFLGAAGELGISAVDLSRYDVSEKTKFM
jgi:quinol monooxygenase YgiN